jgi:glucosamine-6-phosphate deaminase
VKLLWMSGAAELSDRAAVQVAALLRRKAAAAIALPTGRTPRGMYERLVALHRAGEFSCRDARFFNLDEFVGLGPNDPASYGTYLRRHFLNQVDADSSRIRLLRGDAADLDAECRDHDRAIHAAGGLDLAILGLGRNGHVAFNEPGSDWRSVTHRVVLSESTRSAQRQQFPSDEVVPREGLTMGMQTIRAARAILLLVAGVGKAAGLAALRAGRRDPSWPVTGLLDHVDLVVLADRACAGTGEGS